MVGSVTLYNVLQRFDRILQRSLKTIPISITSLHRIYVKLMDCTQGVWYCTQGYTGKYLRKGTVQTYEATPCASMGIGRRCGARDSDGRAGDRQSRHGDHRAPAVA